MLFGYKLNLNVQDLLKMLPKYWPRSVFRETVYLTYKQPQLLSRKLFVANKTSELNFTHMVQPSAFDDPE